MVLVFDRPIQSNLGLLTWCSISHLLKFPTIWSSIFRSSIFSATVASRATLSSSSVHRAALWSGMRSELEFMFGGLFLILFHELLVNGALLVVIRVWYRLRVWYGMYCICTSTLPCSASRQLFVAEIWSDWWTYIVEFCCASFFGRMEERWVTLQVCMLGTDDCIFGHAQYIFVFPLTAQERHTNFWRHQFVSFSGLNLQSHRWNLTNDLGQFRVRMTLRVKCHQQQKIV